MDIRLLTNIFGNTKIKKLRRRAGADGLLALFQFWCWAAEQRPDGSLAGLDQDDIADAIASPGTVNFDAVAVVQTFLDFGFIDRDESGGYVIHDWAENQPWVVGKKKRSADARHASRCKWAAKNNAPRSAEDNSAHDGAQVYGITARTDSAVRTVCEPYAPRNAPFLSLPLPSNSSEAAVSPSANGQTAAASPPGAVSATEQNGTANGNGAHAPRKGSGMRDFTGTGKAAPASAPPPVPVQPSTESFALWSTWYTAMRGLDGWTESDIRAVGKVGIREFPNPNDEWLKMLLAKCIDATTVAGVAKNLVIAWIGSQAEKLNTAKPVMIGGLKKPRVPPPSDETIRQAHAVWLAALAVVGPTACAGDKYMQARVEALFR